MGFIDTSLKCAGLHFDFCIELRKKHFLPVMIPSQDKLIFTNQIVSFISVQPMGIEGMMSVGVIPLEEESPNNLTKF